MSTVNASTCSMATIGASRVTAPRCKLAGAIRCYLAGAAVQQLLSYRPAAVRQARASQGLERPRGAAHQRDGMTRHQQVARDLDHARRVTKAMPCASEKHIRSVGERT